MAQLIYNIPDDQVTRAINALALFYGYRTEIDGQPNPEGKAPFVKRMIGRELRHRVIRIEKYLASETLQPDDPGITVE